MSRATELLQALRGVVLGASGKFIKAAEAEQYRVLLDALIEREQAGGNG